jgi:predicted ATPase
MNRDRRSNLSEPLTELVGRDSALDQLESRFERESRRWITIRGVPGVGKTRLALHYAATQPLSRYPGGIWSCDLTRARNGKEIRSVVARVLRLPITSTVAAIGQALARCSRTLLVLDGAEHVAHLLGPILQTWLTTAPALRVLVTSERRIGVPGETAFVLEPLEEHDANALFRARAFETRGGELSPQSDAAIATIVRTLGALPLAIELAASACSALCPEELVPHIADILDALIRKTGRARAASTRLLSSHARAVLQICSLFAGDFSPDLVEAIHSGPPGTSALALSELCDRSLLSMRENARGTVMTLPVTVRGPVRRELERASSKGGVRARFQQAVLGRAERAMGELESGSGVHTLSLLRHDLERITSHALARDDLRNAARGVLALASLSVLQGPADHTWSLLEAMIAREQTFDAETRARLRYARGRLSRHLGRHAIARNDLDVARHIAESLEQMDFIARIAIEQAHLLRHLARRDEASGYYQRALAIHEMRSNIAGQGRTLAALAGMAHEAGELDRAREFFAQAIGLLERTPNRLELATARQNLGLVELEAGELELAEQTFLRALEGHRALGHRRFEAICGLDLACLELERGRARAALAHLRDAGDHVRTSGDRRELGWAAALTFACHAVLGELEDARDIYVSATREVRALEEPGLIEAVDVLWGLRDLTIAFKARLDGDAETVKRQLRSVDARIERVEHMRSAGDEFRFALRLLRKERARFATRAESVLIADDGAWFSAPGKARVNLAHKPLLRALLAALLRHHLHRPDLPVSPEDLMRACWPKERVTVSVHKNRLHVAIATLRELGFRSHLVGDRTGYRLELVEIVTKDG